MAKTASAGAAFASEIQTRYDLSPHEERLVRLAGEALDRALAAGAEFERHVDETGSVLLSGKAHPAALIARDQGRLFELLVRSASLPADVSGASVKRLREVS